MTAGLGYLFQRAVEQTPDEPAVIQRRVSLTYGELDERANLVASTLQLSGIAPGSRVALLFDNDYRFVEFYFGTLRAGAVVVPINHRLSDGQVEYIINHSDAEVVVCAPTQARRLNGQLTTLAGVKLVVGLDDAASGMVAYDQMSAEASGTPTDVSVDDDDVAAQPYTSGSTGMPKGCLLTHGGQRWNAAVSAKLRGVTSEDRTLTAAPLCHKNAMAGALKPTLWVGGCVVIERSFGPETYLVAIERHSITVTTGVPAMYQLIANRPDLAARYDSSSVRFCFVGSAEVTGELRRAMQEVFPNARIREGYGSTEGGPISLVQGVDGAEGLLPVDDTSLRVVDANGRDCPAGTIGELLLKSPGVLAGYYKNPDATQERLLDGWYHTGDLVRCEDTQRYFIVGRMDDMIITGGENVYPKHVESILLGHPHVNEACVVPVPHAVKGRVPVAFVVLTHPGAATAEEIKRFFLESGPAFAHPRAVFPLETLPYSAPGKIDRQLLRSKAQELYAADGQGAAPEV